MNGWKNEFVPPFLWAILAFIEVLSFTVIVPKIAPEIAQKEVFDLWYVLLTATVLRIRTPKAGVSSKA